MVRGKVALVAPTPMVLPPAMRTRGPTSAKGAHPGEETSSGSFTETLRRDIQAARLKANERLREVEIAARYGVTRSRVREALQTLHAERLVDIRPGQGASVAALSIFDFYDLMEVRAALFTTVARQAATRATDAELAEIARRLEELGRSTRSRPGDGEVVNASRIGLSLAVASRNKRAHALLVKLAGRTVWPYLRVAAPAATSAVVAIWEQLAQALLRRDTAEAGRLAGDAIRTRRREIVDGLLATGGGHRETSAVEP